MRTSHFLANTPEDFTDPELFEQLNYGYLEGTWRVWFECEGPEGETWEETRRLTGCFTLEEAVERVSHHAYFETLDDLDEYAEVVYWMVKCPEHDGYGAEGDPRRAGGGVRYTFPRQHRHPRLRKR